MIEATKGPRRATLLTQHQNGRQHSSEGRHMPRRGCRCARKHRCRQLSCSGARPQQPKQPVSVNCSSCSRRVLSIPGRSTPKQHPPCCATLDCSMMQPAGGCVEALESCVPCCRVSVKGIRSPRPHGGHRHQVGRRHPQVDRRSHRLLGAAQQPARDIVANMLAAGRCV